MDQSSDVVKIDGDDGDDETDEWDVRDLGVGPADMARYKKEVSDLVAREESAYLKHSMEYFSDTRRRFGVEILAAKTTFFLSDHDLLKQLDAPARWSLVGEGNFGKVYRTKWLGIEVAVKTRCDVQCDDTTLTRLNSTNSMASSTNSIEESLNLFEEYEIHRRLRHPNIVAFFVASPAFIVTEFMCNSNLVVALHSKTGDCVPDVARRITWALQMTRAVRYLHANKIVHSDIKPSNVIFDEHWNLKLCDVGASYFSHVPNRSKIFSDAFVPLHFYALTSREKYLGKRTDLYALGVVLLSVLTWSDRIIDACGGEGIEREMCEIDASDVSERKKMGLRLAAVTRRLEVVLPRVWDTISNLEIGANAKVILFRWIASLSENHCGSARPLLDSVLRGKNKSDRRELDCFADQLEQALRCRTPVNNIATV